MNQLPRICKMIEALAERHDKYEPARAFAQSLLFSELHNGRVSRRLVEGPNAVKSDEFVGAEASQLLEEIGNSLSSIMTGLVGGASGQYNSVLRLQTLMNQAGKL